MKLKNLIIKKYFHLIFLFILFINIAEADSLLKVNGMSEKELVNFLIDNADSLPEEDLSGIETYILSNENFDTGDIGLKLINSGKSKLQATGLELISDVCVNRPKLFQPNSFYTALINSGPKAEPYIVNIIRNTQNDFCREWACEVYVRMFSKFYADKESRIKLSFIQKKEQKLYENIKKFFDDPEKVKKLYETRQSLGNVVRLQWGEYNRYPLRLNSILNLLDNLNRINHDATVKLINKIIDTKNFDYNLLSTAYPGNDKAFSIPDNLRLRYLAKAVFANKAVNTYDWLPEDKGGFSEQELKIALRKNDRKRIREMTQILHQFVCAVLLRQLVTGDGNKEINILRKFYFSTWKKELKWDDCLLTVHNKSNHGVPLILIKQANIQQILTGKGVDTSSAEEKHQEFYIPANSKFVWFAPSGEYRVKINLKKTEVKNGHIFHFKTREFTLEKSNLTLNIY